MINFIKQPKGISQIAILAIVLVLAAILAGGVYWYSQNQENMNGNGNTNTVANVNTANENLNIATNLNTNTSANRNTNSDIVNNNLNTTFNNTNVNEQVTYRNSQYGFQLAYPTSWNIEEREVSYGSEKINQIYWSINVLQENPSDSNIQTQLVVSVFRPSGDETEEQTYLRVTTKDISSLYKEIRNVDGIEGTYYKDVPAFTPFNMILVRKAGLLFSIERGEISETTFTEMIASFQFINQ